MCIVYVSVCLVNKLFKQYFVFSLYVVSYYRPTVMLVITLVSYSAIRVKTNINFCVLKFSHIVNCIEVPTKFC